MSKPGEQPPEVDAFSDELIAEGRGDRVARMPDDMHRLAATIITVIDTFSLWCGRIICWITVPIMVAMVYEVIARKFFLAPTVWAYDVSRMLYGALFMLGAGYALWAGVHIRADFIYRNLSVRTQGMIDTGMYVLFYFPGLIFFLWASLDYASAAWIRGERGMDTAWMPHMGPIKTVLPVAAVLLLVQGVSELLKSYYAARKGRWPS